MRVCVVGSGGREHALAHTLARTADVVVTPGNPGMAAPIVVDESPVEEIDADLYVVGPEAPLVAGLADNLLDAFSLPARRRVRNLSRGQRSALGIVIGLACQAEVTVFDEPYGLDAVARQIFYDWLLADYAARPRTVLLSTHLIDEAAGLLERVLVMDKGKIVLDAAADDVRGAAISISGPAIAVTEFTAGRTVWNRRRIAGQESAVVAGPLDESEYARARALRLNLEPLTLQQVVVHAASQHDTDARERTSA